MTNYQRETKSDELLIRIVKFLKYFLLKSKINIVSIENENDF